jgi:DNA-binding NarL/FixJ family response regulator
VWPAYWGAFARRGKNIRILIVDDHKDWRHKVRLLFQARPQWQIVCEVSDGLEAVQRAEELRPDLILLDIGLPKLNGIETARRIRNLVPESKILFLSQQSDADVIEEALSLGSGYVVKVRAGRELLPATNAVLQGNRFVSGSVADRDQSREGVESNILQSGLQIPHRGRARQDQVTPRILFLGSEGLVCAESVLTEDVEC